MIERAGLWRRALAAVVDMVVAQVALQLLVVLLFAATHGAVMTTYGLSTACRPVADLPEGTDLPPGALPSNPRLCTARFFGAPTRVIFEAELRRTSGDGTELYATPTLPDGTSVRRVLDLDVLFFPLFILIRWVGDRSFGGSVGRKLGRIAVAMPDGVPARTAISRRMAAFAWPYWPGIALVGATATWAFEMGSAPPLLMSLSWAAGSILIPASQLAAVMAVLGRRDAFYDEAVGTAVVPRSAAASADEVPARATRLAEPSSRRWPLPWMTLALAAIMVAVFAAEVLAPAGPGNLQGVGTRTLLAYGAMDRDLVMRSGQVYRLITAVFVHGSITHVALNLLVLLVSGWMLESLVGPLWLLAVFGLGSLGASAASVAINGADQIAAGASGATLALSAALLVLTLRVPPGGRRDWLRAWPIATAFPALVPSLPLAGTIAVDHADHVGGALAGIVTGGIILACWRQNRPAPSRGIVAAAAAGAVTLAALASIPFAGVAIPPEKPLLVPAGEAPRTREDWLARGPALAERYPDDPRALLFRSQAEALAGDGRAATEEADRAIAASRRLPPAAFPGFAFRAHAETASRFFETGDLERAIAQYDAALAAATPGDPPERALVTRQRGIAQFFRKNPRGAADDLARAVAMEPGDAYAALWLTIVRERTGLASSTQALTEALTSENWPSPLLRFYLGEADAAGLDRSVESGDPRLFETRRCEADLYLGEWHVMRHEDEAARALLMGAKTECPHDFVEYRAASEELAGAAGFAVE